MNKLVNVLIAKSILETILVGAIAVGVYMNAFPPTFHGWGEAVPGIADDRRMGRQYFRPVAARRSAAFYRWKVLEERTWPFILDRM